MAGITGKNSLSVKKQDVKESKIPAIGFNKIRFMHEASAAQTSIILSDLTTPADAMANGFVQPTINVLNSLHLSQFRENFELKSSLKGDLQEYLAYRLVGANKITLLFEAEEGEIFTGIMDHNPRVGMSLVDGAPLVVTGSLAAGSTDFNVGTPIQVGLNPSAQHGAVMVMVDGQIAYRNSGNQVPGPGVVGDYREVHAGGGLGSIIRFNVADLSNDRNISVISIGSLIERPSGSQLALIEAIAGEVDTHREILEALTDTDIVPGAPSSVDLKAFGDQVQDHEARIDVLETPNDFFVGTAQTVNASVQSNTSFATPDQPISITFVPSRSGKYKVHGVVDIQPSTASQILNTKITNTVGAPTVVVEQVASGANGTGEDIMFYPFGVYELQAGVSYTFTLQTKSDIASNYQVLSANVSGGVRLFAEEMR